MDVILFRLDAGRTADELMALAAVARTPTELQQLGTFMGGGIVSRGRPYAFDVELTAATYVLMDITRRPAKLGEIVVAGTPTGEALPAADRTVRLKDFKIVAPATLPRDGAIRVVNNGDSPHFVIGFPLRRARDLRDAVRHLGNGRFRKLGPLIGGPSAQLVDFLSPGIDNVAHLRLRRGAWVLACFYADDASRGVPHSMMGMVTGTIVR